MLSHLLTLFTATSLQTSCPADHPTSRAIAERFMTRPAYAADRQHAGVAGYSSADVRLLSASNSADATVCARFSVLLGGTGATGEWQWSIYQVGSVYVVATRHVRSDGGYHMELLPLYVFDSNLNVVVNVGI